jgi:hypothetical protein
MQIAAMPQRYRIRLLLHSYTSRMRGDRTVASARCKTIEDNFAVTLTPLAVVLGLRGIALRRLSAQSRRWVRGKARRTAKLARSSR